MIFTRRLPSWQTEAVAVVARRTVWFLRLDLLCQIVPSDLWLRRCCILRLDRSSQGLPRSKHTRRTLAALAPPPALAPFVEDLPMSVVSNLPDVIVAVG